MDWQISEITDSDVILARSVEGGIATHTIPWQAIASWSELLGVPDYDLVLEAIIRDAHETPDGGITDWSPMYQALRAVRKEEEEPVPAPTVRTMRAVVAPSHSALDQLVTAQAEARAQLNLDAPRVLSREEAESPIAVAVNEHAGKIASLAAEFRTGLGPTLGTTE